MINGPDAGTFENFRNAGIVELVIRGLGDVIVPIDMLLILFIAAGGGLNTGLVTIVGVEVMFVICPAFEFSPMFSLLPKSCTGPWVLMTEFLLLAGWKPDFNEVKIAGVVVTAGMVVVTTGVWTLSGIEIGMLGAGMG